jgi:hypothetical protein
MSDSMMSDINWAQFFIVETPTRDILSIAQERKPFIIEFAGTPNAGKDTLISIIKDYLEDAHKNKTRILDEGVKFSSVSNLIDRLHQTVALTVVQLFESKYENPGNNDYIILNRGLFDKLAFLHTLQLQNSISAEQEQIIINYLLSYAHMIDIVFLFLISSQESLLREEKTKNIVNKLHGERDRRRKKELRNPRIVNTDMIESLNASYLHMYHKFKGDFDNQIYLFDSTDRSDMSLMTKARALAELFHPKSTYQLSFPWEMEG